MFSINYALTWLDVRSSLSALPWVGPCGIGITEKTVMPAGMQVIRADINGDATSAAGLNSLPLIFGQRDPAAMDCF